jgi:hypothetical protein
MNTTINKLAVHTEKEVQEHVRTKVSFDGKMFTAGRNAFGYLTLHTAKCTSKKFHK